MKRMSFLMMCVVTGLSLLATGCSRSTQPDPISEEAIEPQIQADCIAHYYKSNGSAYITRQQHGFTPSLGLFHAYSSEPAGPVECLLTRDGFSSTGQEKELLPDLPRQLWSKHLAASVFYSFSAGGGLLDTSAMAKGDNVRIEGRWYQPVVTDWSGQLQLTLYRTLDTERVELVKMEDSQQELSWLLKSYNYRYSKELDGLIPRAIDVFNISDGLGSKALMIRFDYKNIR